jgi:hypothetical protein
MVASRRVTAVLTPARTKSSSSRSSISPASESVPVVDRRLHLVVAVRL